MSPRRITGLNSHNGYMLPTIEHIKEVSYDRYKMSADPIDSLSQQAAKVSVPLHSVN